MKKESRRDFIKKSITGVLALGLASPLSVFADDKKSVLNLKGKVVIGQNDNILTDTSIPARIINDGLNKLLGKTSAKDSWSTLFSAKDVVGIKLNTIAGKGMSPKPVIVDAIIEGLKSAGVKENNIIAWDRTSRELRRAGFTINKSDSGVQYYGTDGDFDAQPTEHGSIGSCFSKILSEKCTAIINVGVLKNHGLAGVSIGMKNFYGAINNPNKYHGNHCDPFIADLYDHPLIKNKTRLTIIDGFKAQYNGGPSYKPNFCWDYKGIMMGIDPVAVDVVGADIINKKRIEMDMGKVKEPKWIESAVKKGLGVGDLKNIEVIQV